MERLRAILVSLNTRELVEKGLFPENLPPVFTTRQVWGYLSGEATNYSINSQTKGHCAGFDASKRGGQRRLFGIPHPLFLRDMGVFFDKHWIHIEGIFDGSTGSVSKPQLNKSNYRCVRITSHAELPKIRFSTLSRYKYCLVADVSRFFNSIYTHSIPWALHGKTAAKADFANFSAQIFGNRLDLICRQAQSQQTIGIPVGLDSSKIISEIILSAVDVYFKSFYDEPPSYVRHVDDYWIGGETQDECEKHLQNLRAALRYFELDINEVKTRIISTKFVFRNDWPSEFTKEVKSAFSWSARISKDEDPVATLGKIIDKAVIEDDDGLIRHAIRIIDENKIWVTGWDILEHFIAQCAIQFPHSFDYVARVIVWRSRKGAKINIDLWRHVVLSTLDQSAGLGRDSETVWALWLTKELSIVVPNAISNKIISNNNGIVLAYFAHFFRKKLIKDKMFYKKLWNRVEGDPFAGAYWPLTLELFHLRKENPEWAGSATHSALRSLHENRVSIIDWEARPKVFQSSEQKAEDDDTPDTAIEDYAGDYDNGDELDEDENGSAAKPVEFPDFDILF